MSYKIRIKGSQKYWSDSMSMCVDAERASVYTKEKAVDCLASLNSGKYTSDFMWEMVLA